MALGFLEWLYFLKAPFSEAPMSEADLRIIEPGGANQLGRHW